MGESNRRHTLTRKQGAGQEYAALCPNCYTSLLLKSHSPLPPKQKGAPSCLDAALLRQ